MAKLWQVLRCSLSSPDYVSSLMAKLCQAFCSAETMTRDWRVCLVGQLLTFQTITRLREQPYGKAVHSLWLTQCTAWQAWEEIIEPLSLCSSYNRPDKSVAETELKRNFPFFETENCFFWNGKLLFLKRKITGPTTRHSFRSESSLNKWTIGIRIGLNSTRIAMTNKNHVAF